ncbi:MAG: hypothetical protein DRP68_02020 [Candidatus Omnitrophota bacterium]|nr:MAG: hypothetical protein DRP68_02020 [Candidatus Omnitrophota bacterium]HDN85755.1 hypothetical protein [Candidatus Omnitrophota bacterium]
MKKFLFCILVGINFLIGVKVFSAPCYGTYLPKRNKFLLGIQTHAVFKRYLKDTYGKLRSLQHFLLLSYGVFDWLSLDLKGGTGFIKQHPLNSDEIDYPSWLGGGYGFRVKLYHNPVDKVKVVGGFQHISIHPKKVYLEGVKNKAVLDDWQFSILISKNLNIFTPYIGTKWSRMDYIHWRDGIRKRKKSDLTKSLGLVLGSDISLSRKTYLNLEIHFFDEEAAAISFLCKF